MCGGLAFLASCGPFLNLSSRLSLPFEAGRQSASVDTTVRVLVEEDYSFRLKLQAREGDQADIDRVKALAGIGNPYAGREDSAGIPIPIRLRVSRIRGNAEELLIDRGFSDHTLEVSAPDPAKGITQMSLSRGRYRVRIEALRDIPELAGTPVRFEVFVRHFK